MESIESLLITAFQARQRDLPELALESLEHASQLDPEDGYILIEIANCHLALAEPVQARSVLERAALLAKEDATLALETARLLAAAGTPDRALALLGDVPAGDSQFSQATVEMVILLERLHRLAAAEETLVTRHPVTSEDPGHVFVRALLAERAGDVDYAEKLLRAIWPGAARSELDVECGYRLARLLDRMDRTEEALPMLAACKTLERQMMNAAVLGDFVEQRRRHDLALLGLLPDDWFAQRAPVRGADTLLLLGHPRSGTSLLTRKLSHRTGAAWVDEQPVFESMARRLVRDQPAAVSPDGLLAMLGRLPAAAIAAFQKKYRGRLAEISGDPSPRRLIDKNPGLSQSLPVLHHLLPKTAWLISLRDPRDVAASCYFQRLGATPLGWASLTLEGALASACHALDCWLAVRRRLLPSQFIEVRYEALVADPERVLGEVCRALDWPLVADHAASLPTLNLTPSYAQILDPVHGRAVARWRKLSSQLTSGRVENSALLAAFDYPA